MTAAETEGRLWDEQALRWAELQEGQFRPAFEEALADCAAGTGTRLLDVGCGSGLLLRLAAARGASVSGLDASAGLLEIARRALPEDSDLRVGDLQRLPYAPGVFDVVTSFNALRYARDPVAAVAGFARVARPGARLVLGGWGAPERCETTAMLFGVLALLPAPPAGSDGANTPAAVREAVTRAGLRVGAVREVPCPFVYPDLETAWEALGATGLLRHAAAVVGEERVRDVFDRHMRPSVRADGTLRQDNVCEYTVAGTDG
ncbi:class I SAM-dependent methyltransferase [Streptomyces niveiscabiei]|uniref:class I SAM-dependent methyltransferase n=1 Tax=Streptomyces niveiscabiei TaxID=164115 RepID=UPI0029A1BE29|nr:class I SAM-dependent methyltransferase [Streptomyces niveiscabiei]MDX3386255.1 class I SAM-dependent methyltransferase [Streptomyces niveiscabiei]